MNKAEKNRLARKAIEKALEITDGDEKAAFALLAKAVAATPYGKAGRPTFGWQCRAVLNQLAMLEVIEKSQECDWGCWCKNQDEVLIF